MAEKRVNRLLIVGAVVAGLSLIMVMCSSRKDSFEPVGQLPQYDPSIKRQDGDTQADTIKALQAYAREAVEKADALHKTTEEKLKQVLDSQQQYTRLQRDNQITESQMAETRKTVESLEAQLRNLHRDLSELQHQQSALSGGPDITQFNQDGLPRGFGFDDDTLPQRNSNQGAWYESIDRLALNESGEDDASGRFNGLLPRAPRTKEAATNSADTATKKETIKVVIESAYTIPKDSTLTDAVALTALIGRIPVEGQTPDPYPIKIYIGKENLAANGHELPEVEGMIFSGLGFGDWNLSCVSARLLSATFIFSDGSIVNHSSQGQPLGYISDPSGVPCVVGQFVTNAPAFISQRIGLATIGAAGAAYAEAQQQRQTSPLTGATTSTVVGDIDKLVAGEAVQSATNEVSRWILARQKQSFDAVVVNPGAAVAVHLDQTLVLDKSSIARKLRYGKNSQSVSRDLD